MNIIGIGGLPRSGKDTLAELFIQSGYYGFSFGDFTREYSRRRHSDKPDPISIANMTETSNWLRTTYGPDVILQAALKNYEAHKKADTNCKGLVLFSVRAPIEVDFILSHGGRLIWVETSDEERHRRAQKHLREGEAPISLLEFKAQESLQSKPQLGLPEEVQMNTDYVRAHATDTLENNGLEEEFLQKAQALIAGKSQTNK